MEEKVAELARGGRVQNRDIPGGRRNSSAERHCYFFYFLFFYFFHFIYLFFFLAKAIAEIIVSAHFGNSLSKILWHLWGVSLNNVEREKCNTQHYYMSKIQQGLKWEMCLLFCVDLKNYIKKKKNKELKNHIIHVQIVELSETHEIDVEKKY